MLSINFLTAKANLWDNPSGETINKLPDLVNDANAQIKYIYPVLIKNNTLSTIVFSMIKKTIDDIPLAP